MADDAAYRLLRDIVIPAGTVMRRSANRRGGDEAVEAVVGMGRDAVAWLVLPVNVIPDVPEYLITEVAGST